MLATAQVRPGVREAIPAVVHVDGSARVQTVNRTHNPQFWMLINAYKQLTGLPVVLNTSFNHADEPIVCSPADAVHTFVRCRLDAVVLGHYVIRNAPSA